jgi:phosphatidylethanolamine/phosphatidyl-N-methylethanolamine N-methyltransferase
MPIYDKFARYYDRAFAPLERVGLAASRREAIALLPENARILELGCGTGANFEYYPESRLAVSTELSFQMLSAAKAKQRSNILVNADAQHLPFGESEFDAAFATLVFCSIPQPELAFAELKRVVRKGGTVVLLEHVRPSGFLGVLFDGLSKATTAVFEDHFNRRTAKTAERCGLEVLEVRRKLFGVVNLIVCRV